MAKAGRQPSTTRCNRRSQNRGVLRSLLPALCSDIENAATRTLQAVIADDIMFDVEQLIRRKPVRKPKTKPRPTAAPNRRTSGQLSRSVSAADVLRQAFRKYPRKGRSTDAYAQVLKAVLDAAPVRRPMLLRSIKRRIQERAKARNS